jgi:prephenate dehydrogenase
MRVWNTVSIIGVGLIGGSIGLALLRRGLAQRVVGIGRRQASLAIAIQQGAVTDATTDLDAGVAEAELIVACTPVAQIPRHLWRAAGACPPGALLTDAGSTKQNIVEALSQPFERQVAFVGSHPLAGSEKTGAQSAQEDLFQGRVVVVTPIASSAPEHVDAVADFWTSLGATVVRMSPEQHDRAVAETSHLPHLVASALAASTDRQLLQLVASGWLDTTRKASGDPQLWLQIVRDNRAHVLKSLDKFAKVLDRFRDSIDQDDAARILELLEAGKQCRDAVGN